MRRILAGVGEDPKAWNSRERLFGTPVDPQIFEARRCGLPHGSVRRCLHGFLDEEQIRGQHPDYDNGMLPLDVELLGTREALDGFCLHARELLGGPGHAFPGGGALGAGRKRGRDQRG